jgi:RNA polymerase subunit RPABC4/transcription elongation factor Spt4
MRYCNHCHRITTGEPLFCNFCGRSYDFKLCPHRHPNPRSAEVCNQCGSREMSTPHPKVPFWMASLLTVLSVVPGVLLLLLSVMFLVGFLRVVLSSQQLMFEFMLIGLFIGFLWWLYMKLPRFLRRRLSKLIGRGKAGDDRGH